MEGKHLAKEALERKGTAPQTASVSVSPDSVRCPYDCRAEFEKWISSPPFERVPTRYGNDPTKYAWPGAYDEIDVELAWQCWLASFRKSVAAEMLAVLKELQESASYWSDYDVPLGIVDRINAVISKAMGLKEG